MKTIDVLNLILLGAITLYCAKLFIQASANATSDSFEAFHAILGWSLYLIGWMMFVGGIVVTGVKLVVTSAKDKE